MVRGGLGWVAGWLVRWLVVKNKVLHARILGGNTAPHKMLRINKEKQ